MRLIRSVCNFNIEPSQAASHEAVFSSWGEDNLFFEEAMRNQKWVTLASKLEVHGWNGPEDSRILRREYFAGRAQMLETAEETGDRTIYFYATPHETWADRERGG